MYYLSKPSINNVIKLIITFHVGIEYGLFTRVRLSSNYKSVDIYKNKSKKTCADMPNLNFIIKTFSEEMLKYMKSHMQIVQIHKFLQ